VNWRRRTVRLRVDRELAEKVAAAFRTSADPQALSEILRAHIDCERQRERLVSVVEKAAQEVLGWERKYRSLEGQHENLLRENAALIAERRRLEETLRELRRQSRQGRAGRAVAPPRGTEQQGTG